MGSQILEPPRRLYELTSMIGELDESMTIYAEKPNGRWEKDSSAQLLPRNKRDERMPNLVYFMEVFLAKNVIGAWSHVREGRVPTAEEAFEALNYFAENDAYLLPDVDVMQG